MTQSVIKKKLIAFLQCQARKQNNDPDVKELEERLSIGFCFGFSVCHGAMDLIGKLDWWEDALRTIAQWDENKESLDRKIHLINENDPNNPSTLQKIFERALNYIVFFQVANLKNFDLSTMFQDNLFQPNAAADTSFFELLDAEGKRQTIKQYETATGFFTPSELCELLDKDRLANTITLVHSNNHVIRIGYRDYYWFVYNPNYNHQTLNDTIYKKFYCKEDLTQEIQRILGVANAITAASLNYRDQPFFPAYPTLLKNNPLRLIVNYAFSLSIEYNPHGLMQFLESIDDSAQAAESKNALAIALTENPDKDDGWTGLHILARSLPKALGTLLQMMDESDLGIKLTHAFASALDKKNENQTTGLYLVARFGFPEIWAMLNKLMNDSPTGIHLTKAFRSALFEKDETSESAFNWLLKKVASRQFLLQHIYLLDGLNADTLNTISEHDKVSVFYWLANTYEGLQILQARPQIFSLVSKQSLNAISKMDRVSAFYRLIESRDGVAVLINSLPANTNWFRNVDARTIHAKPSADKPSIAKLLTQTRHGKRLLETFPQLKLKVLPERMLGKRRAEEQLVRLNPIRNNKRQKKEVEEKPSTIGLFASRDQGMPQAKPAFSSKTSPNMGRIRRFV